MSGAGRAKSIRSAGRISAPTGHGYEPAGPAAPRSRRSYPHGIRPSRPRPVGPAPSALSGRLGAGPTGSLLLGSRLVAHVADIRPLGVLSCPGAAAPALLANDPIQGRSHPGARRKASGRTPMPRRASRALLGIGYGLAPTRPTARATTAPTRFPTRDRRAHRQRPSGRVGPRPFLMHMPRACARDPSVRYTRLIDTHTSACVGQTHDSDPYRVRHALPDA